MAVEDAVVIATYPNEIEAELAVSWLEAEGVATVVLSDDAGSVLPMLQISRGVKILVAPENADRAREILEKSELQDDAIPDSPGDADPRAPGGETP